MTYVDGFVLVIKKSKVPAYKKMASEAGKVWKRHGALDYKECIGDDMHPDMQGMKATNFPKMAGAKKGETVWFSFIVYKSKAHRNSVNASVMKYFSEKYKDKKMDMPFDMKRFAYGGFKAVVDEKR